MGVWGLHTNGSIVNGLIYCSSGGAEPSRTSFVLALIARHEGMFLTPVSTLEHVPAF